MKVASDCIQRRHECFAEEVEKLLGGNASETYEFDEEKKFVEN